MALPYRYFVFSRLDPNCEIWSEIWKKHTVLLWWLFTTLNLLSLNYYFRLLKIVTTQNLLLYFGDLWQHGCEVIASVHSRVCGALLAEAHHCSGVTVASVHSGVRRAGVHSGVTGPPLADSYQWRRRSDLSQAVLDPWGRTLLPVGTRKLILCF